MEMPDHGACERAPAFRHSRAAGVIAALASLVSKLLDMKLGIWFQHLFLSLPRLGDLRDGRRLQRKFLLLIFRPRSSQDLTQFRN